MSASVKQRAAEWLALQAARSLTLREQADFVEWIAVPAHRETYNAVQATWRRLDHLTQVSHSVDRLPDPDLLAPRRRPSRLPAVFAAAAAIALVAWAGWQFVEHRGPVHSTSVISANRLLSLPDGSLVKLNADAEIQQHFTATERRLTLTRGEACFTVAKNADRPFIVTIEGVSVRAVGTIFNVRLDQGSVEVLVTEGTVKVAPPGVALTGADELLATLTIGQRTTVPLRAIPDALPVLAASPSEIDQALAWQNARFTFEDMRLADVVARYNQQAAQRPHTPRLRVDDARLLNLRISGRVHTDDVNSFVEVLETSFDVTADRSASGEVVLRRR